ncbi:MAG: hypothetical protein KDH92_07880 [Chloroflexi bacterium]|nr:hypothetical protein [Chloroflexota bacterium]
MNRMTVTHEALRPVLRGLTALGVLALAVLAPASRAAPASDPIFAEDFPSPDALQDPRLTLLGDSVDRLVWSSGADDGIAGPRSGGALYSYPRDPQRQASPYAHLVYRIDAPPGLLLGDPSASITLHTRGPQFAVRLAASPDGLTWDDPVEAATEDYLGTELLVSDQAGAEAYQGLSTVFYRVSMPTFDLGSPPPTVQLAVLDDLAVRATVTEVAPGALSEGRRILLRSGLQIQAVVGDVPEGLHPERWRQSGFSAPMLVGSLRSTGGPLPAGGGPWGRWVDPAEGIAVYPSERETVQQLLSLQYDDEQDLSAPEPLRRAIEALDAWRDAYPDTLIYTSQWGSQLGVEQLRAYLLHARPRLLMFASYPFDGQLAGGSPTAWYADLQKYQALAAGGIDGSGRRPLPCGLWLQTFTIAPQRSHVVSESELRLNQFAAWAFGCTFASAYVYNASEAFGSIQSVLFEGRGDARPTATFAQMARSNAASRRLGPALVRLRGHDIAMLPGRHARLVDGVTTEVENDLPKGLTRWQPDSDSFLTAVSASNPGLVNAGLPGDVLMGAFRPLLAPDDLPTEPGQRYFMVVNGLTGPEASAAEARQRIRLDFDFAGTPLRRLLRLSRDSGRVEPVALVHDAGSRYHLDLELDGGTGDLFKYELGPPFLVPGAQVSVSLPYLGR